MKIEIDQSGKIENTSKPTVIAFSNSKNDAVVILAREKKILQRFFRQIERPRLFVYLSFAAAICILVKNVIKKCHQIVLDREYSGFEKLINNKLKEFISENYHVQNVRIITMQIGKKSRAHLLAYRTYKQKDKCAVRKIRAEEIIEIIKQSLKSGST